MPDDLTSLLAETNLLESPRIVSALEEFVVEAIEEATDLLRTGDMATRTSLIRTIVAMALKTRDTTSTDQAEAILAQTRAAIAGEVL
jgi:hypothetical protein